MELTQAAQRLRAALADASSGLVERESLVELIALAAVAREHLLIIGPPGTAKSEAVRRVAAALSGQYFEYLLGRFTEPGELFGPIDLQRLRDGVVEARTEGMLPEAEIAFLDEVFLGSTAILNTLLQILNERTYHRGQTRIQCPLRICVGASNGLPDDDSLQAFPDRFMVRAFIEPIADPQLEELLEAGWSGAHREPRTASVADLDILTAHAKQVDPQEIRQPLADAIRMLRGAGIYLSDRRIVKTQHLIAAAAVFAGRTTPTRADLWPLIYVVPDAESQALARTVLRGALEESENPTLSAATEQASHGPRARATRIAQAGSELLASQPTDPVARHGWLLRLEGVAREIDAAFHADSRPTEVEALREALAAHLT